MGIFKEIKNFIHYKRLPISQKLITVYSEHAGYTVNFMSTLDVLLSKYNINICYVTSDINDPILHKSHSRIIPLYINKLLSPFMAVLNSPVCLMTMPDIDTYHIKRSSHKVHYIYIFHALMSSHMVYRFGAFDHFDTILCTGEYQIKEIRKTEELYNLKPKNLIKAGYTRLDDVYNQYQNYLKTSPNKHGTKVLLAPGWASNNIIETSGKDIINSLTTKGYNVKLRYHPETVRRRQDIVKSFDEYFVGNSRVEIEKCVSGNTSFLEADILITDWSGVSLEYAFGTERPVVFIDVPRKIMNERYEELGITPFEVTVRNEIGVVVKTEEIHNIADVVTDLLANGSKYKERIINLRNENVFNFLRSAEVNADAIIECLKKYR